MENCERCGDPTLPDNLIDGKCGACSPKIKVNEGNELLALEEASESILLTTETSPDINIQERLEIITAECVFGINLFQDLIAAMSDTFGGRSNSTQNLLRNARLTVLRELKKEAYRVGANAVVAVSLDYNEFSGKGKSMLFVVASGTAVKIGE